MSRPGESDFFHPGNCFFFSLMRGSIIMEAAAHINNIPAAHVPIATHGNEPLPQRAQR